MFNQLAKQKFTFRHLKNLESHTKDLAKKIETIKIRKAENALTHVQTREVVYHPCGKDSRREEEEIN